MDDKEIRKILIEILYTVINEAESSPILIQKITEDNLVSVYRLAKKHDLAHIVSNYVYQNKITVEKAELRAKLQKEEMMSVYRNEQMKYTFEQICDIFDEANIPYVPLKGSVIRPYYPYENMRTSCDIDILIHEENLEAAISCLENTGYRCGDKNYHDVSLYSPNKIHLELHFNIQENMDSLDNVLKDAWNYASLVKGSRYEFNKNFFVFYMYAHMAYHFLSGGCGVRSLLDIWVMEHKMNAPYSCAEDLLKKAGIYEFASEMSNISNKCFSFNERDEFSDLILEYICDGGIYGSKENNIAIYKSKDKSSFNYLMERLFFPYKCMIVSYPILKKAPYLLPFCWVVRWMKAIFDNKLNKFTFEMSKAKKIPDQTIREIKEIRSRLGL